jgi:ATP-dependent Lon protease
MAPRDMDDIVIPATLPMLPVRDVVVFPFMILPLFVGRESSIRAVNEALSRDRLIFLASQKEIGEDNPSAEGIYQTGTVAMIMRMRKLPDGRVKILAQGIAKARIKKVDQSTPFFQVAIDRIDEEMSVERKPEEEVLMKTVKEQLEKVINLGKMLSPDILIVVEEITEPGRLADLITSNLGLKVGESQDILETTEGFARLSKVKEILAKELEILAVQAKVRGNQPQGQGEPKNQREQYLRDQMRQIKSELGEMDPKSDEIAEIRDRIEGADMTDEIRTEATKQLGRLERMHPDASEASIIRTYLDWLCDLPWVRSSPDKLDLLEAKRILDEDHFDLEKVKDRILEFLAVRKLRRTNKGPILCLQGPPGVGKTSLGKSVARAMGREFVRISLGGVHDEAEIRGHRRTYVGAMPGRIIQALKQASTNNPVIVLDEIDKLGQDYKGDPSSALLEVLDPEQNHAFRDHYLNLNFDLSKVLFIATSNQLENIPGPLRDRMEVIQLAGYTEEDKVKIARQYIIRKQVEENGLSPNHIEFSDKALHKIVSEYTREAGLRNLERLVGTCARKVAKDVASWDGTVTFPIVQVTPEKVEKFLGPPKFQSNDLRDEDEVGCVTGLAWTQFGGEVLEVEVTQMKGKGGIMLTGSLGDVMKESCHAAMSWIRAHARELGIADDVFQKNEIHVHFPSGAVPKDGPSAGVTITTAIVSLLTDNPVRRDVAMTGEISLLGKVLPIGGIKEKSLAALRYGCKKVILPFRNEKDLIDVPEEFKAKMEFVTVKKVEEVLEHALVNPVFKRKGSTSSGTGGPRGGFGKEPAAASATGTSGKVRRIEEAA